MGSPGAGQGAGAGPATEGLRLGRRDRAVKELKCRDAGFDCDAVVHGETVDDVMAQAGPHATEAHGLDDTPEVADRIRTLVHDA